MKRLFKIIGLIGVALLASLFPTWNFDENLTFPANENPLWKDDFKELKSPLIEELKLAGFSFHINRGTEAGPDGVCFGDFGSDEYWVVQYNYERQEVRAYAAISEINWLGHLLTYWRFSDLEGILHRNLKISVETKRYSSVPEDVYFMCGPSYANDVSGFRRLLVRNGDGGVQIGCDLFRSQEGDPHYYYSTEVRAAAKIKYPKLLALSISSCVQILSNSSLLTRISPCWKTKVRRILEYLLIAATLINIISPFQGWQKNDLIPALRTGLSHFVLTGQLTFVSFAPRVLNEITQCEAPGKPRQYLSP